jgi:hypothetical protein
LPQATQNKSSIASGFENLDSVIITKYWNIETYPSDLGFNL